MAENFDLIFGQNASQAQPWSDTDYQRGWETIGSTPPIAEQFDFVHNRQDKKAQELNNRLTPLENINAISYRQPSTAYAIKDIRYYADLPVGWYLECSVAGTTSSGAITLPSPIVENATVTDGTCTWKIRRISSADGVAVGIILPFAGNGAIPSGYLLCDGAAYSRTALPDLFAAIGTDYGSGDGSTTFNVPDSNQAKRFLQGDTVAGQTKSAGLPNITGGVPIGQQSWVMAGAYGSIFGDGTEAGNNTSPNAGTGGVFPYAKFDASRSSSIYGNSTTVQPDALTMRYIIKAFDGQTADSALIDITQFENELGGKADRSLSNLTQAGKSFSFPSDTYVDITSVFSASGATYTAPADGYLYTKGTTTGANAYLNVGLPTYANVLHYPSSGVDLVMGGHSIRKGQTATLLISNVTINKVLFSYAQGEVPN